VSLVGRGVVITTMTVAGAMAPLSVELRDEAVRLIESLAADAVCVTPHGAGRVLAAPSDVLLVTKAALQDIDPELIERVQGTAGPADPQTAMLDLQWRLNLNGHTVIALDGPITPRIVVDEDLRVAAILEALTVLPGSDLRGPLTSAARTYLAHDGIEVAGRARDAVQGRRRVPDRCLTALMESAVAHLVGAEDAADRARLGGLLDSCGVRAALVEPLHVFVVAPGTGPARERAEQLARRLGESVTVRLGGSDSGVILEDDSPVGGSLDEQPAWADVVVLMATTFDHLRGGAITEAPLVVDLSTLDLVAWLVQGTPGGDRSTALAEILARADLVLAADQKHRDILLGALAGQVRVNAAVYDEDPSLLSLVRTDEDGLALAEFCSRPVRAADSNLPPFVIPTKPGSLALAGKYLREGGPRVLAEKVAGRIARVYKQRVARTR